MTLLPNLLVRLLVSSFMVLFAWQGAGQQIELVHRFEGIAEIERYDMGFGQVVWGGFANGTSDFQIFDEKYELLTIITLPFDRESVLLKKIQPVQYLFDDSDDWLLAVQYESSQQGIWYDVFRLLNEAGESVLHHEPVSPTTPFDWKQVRLRESVLLTTRVVMPATMPECVVYRRGHLHTPLVVPGIGIQFVRGTLEELYAYINPEGIFKVRRPDLSVHSEVALSVNYPNVQLEHVGVNFWTDSGEIEFMASQSLNYAVRRIDGTLLLQTTSLLLSAKKWWIRPITFFSADKPTPCPVLTFCCRCHAIWFRFIGSTETNLF